MQDPRSVFPIETFSSASSLFPSVSHLFWQPGPTTAASRAFLQTLKATQDPVKYKLVHILMVQQCQISGYWFSEAKIHLSNEVINNIWMIRDTNDCTLETIRSEVTIRAQSQDCIELEIDTTPGSQQVCADVIQYECNLTCSATEYRCWATVEHEISVCRRHNVGKIRLACCQLESLQNC